MRLASGKLATGKIACERVCVDKVASRRSKNHDKDDEYEKDVSMTAKQYEAMMVKKIFPKIVTAFKHTGVREVRVQQDGARCHTQKKADGTEPMTAKLNAIGAKLKPRIVVVTQPAQSPDLNICDLAFFRALACLLRKRRRIASGESRTCLFDLDKLAADTKAAFEEYSPEVRLKRCGHT